MTDKRELLYIGILLSLWLFAGRVLIAPGFIPTHDGEYHIIRFHEFFTMLSHGYMFPRWAPGLNSGYGFPLFNFHYPFPNYIGSLFQAVGFGLVDSFKLTLFSGYVIAGLACYMWLKKLFSPRAAFIGAAVFSYVPYWFVDLYVRGSVGEVLALMWVMLTLAAIEHKRWIWIALCVAGLVVSHNILAMIFVPLLSLYSILHRPRAFWFIATGIYLSAYFWLPAIFERQFVVGLNSTGFSDHFPDITQLLLPSWGTGFSKVGAEYDEMSQQIGIAPLFIVLCSFFKMFGEKNRKIKIFIAGSLVLCALSIFMMLHSSIWIWQAIPLVQFIQYPWRLLSVIVPLIGILGAYIAYHKKWFFGVILISLALACAFSYTKPVVYTLRSDEYYLSRKEFTDGTSSMGNSLSTIWVRWMSTRAKRLVEYRAGAGEIQYQSMLPLRYDFLLNNGQQGVLRVNTLYYPGWKVWLDGVGVDIDAHSGLIEFVVPPGSHSVRVQFIETPVRLMADFVSLLSLFWLLGLAILKGRYAHRN